MYSTGGNTEMIQMSCFSNMKIYTRYVVASISFSLPLQFTLQFSRRTNTAVSTKVVYNLVTHQHIL